jgi:hypothetical protein
LDPSGSCGSKGQFTLLINTDLYGRETSWSLKESSSSIPIASVPTSTYTNDLEYTITYDYRTPGYESKFCLTPGSTYILLVSDSYGDGMCCGYGLGSFSGMVDGVEMFSNDGEFGTSIIEQFTVPQ